MLRNELAKMVSWLRVCHLDGCSLVYSVLPPVGGVIDALLAETETIDEISRLVWSNYPIGKENC